MSFVAGAIMIGASVVCVAGSIRARHTVPIIAASVMLLAMIDHAFLGAVSPVIWAAALVLSGLGLGLGARKEARMALSAVGAHDTVAGAPSTGSGTLRAAAVASALAYILMAWLVLMTGHGDDDAAQVASPHDGHGSGELLSSAPLVAGLSAAAMLLLVAVRAFRERMRMVGIESVGMSAMIVAMTVAHL